MSLNVFAADLRRKLLDELQAGKSPSVGRYDEELLKQGRVKGKPQMGTVRYTPTSIAMEFIFSSPDATATVLVVEVDAPERIVWLPVPEWVIQTIWQGDVDGSYHFESDAMQLAASYMADLAPEANAKLFGARTVIRRE